VPPTKEEEFGEEFGEMEQQQPKPPTLGFAKAMVSMSNPPNLVLSTDSPAPPSDTEATKTIPAPTSVTF
jgi:hypothetical protein